MKKLCFILMIIVSIMFSGCGTKNDITDNTAVQNNTKKDTTVQSNANYDITKKTYSDKGINISYPQIEKMSDSDKQNKINGIIKNQALNVKNDYEEDMENINLELDYEISFKGSDVLSIKYLGSEYLKDAAHPNNIICTTNINIDKGTSLELSDVVSIDHSFVNKFKGGKYKAWSNDLNLETEGEFKNILESLDNKDLLEQLKEETARFYFTKDCLVVSVEIPHAVGDHMELSIAYKDLGNLLLTKPTGIEISQSEDLPQNTQSNSSNKEIADKNIDIDNVPALELVNALCYSEVLHYDSFINEPDEITTTYTIWNLIHDGEFRWKDIVKVYDGAYYFSYGSESETVDTENNTYVSPDELYQDYFAKGEYKYPPQELSMLIGGTQTGIAVYMSDGPYGVDVKVKNMDKKDDKVIVTIAVSRFCWGDDKKAKLLGDAVITLEKAINPCYFGYKIVSYEPKYDKFEDIA